MYRWLIASLALLAATAGAAPAWTWVDENGRRHFSDTPVPGATQIELAESQTFGRAPESAATPAAPAREPVEVSRSTVPYTAFNIVSPAHQQTLWNIGAALPVEVELTPPLQMPHRLDVVIDGQRVEVGARSARFTVSDVFRGMHTLQAVVVDESGEEVLRSRAITIMVQQTSILNPNNPNNPNRPN